MLFHGILPHVNAPVGSSGPCSDRSQNFNPDPIAVHHHCRRQLQDGAIVAVAGALVGKHPKVDF